MVKLLKPDSGSKSVTRAGQSVLAGNSLLSTKYTTVCKSVTSVHCQVSVSPIDIHKYQCINDCDYDIGIQCLYKTVSDCDGDPD